MGLLRWLFSVEDEEDDYDMEIEEIQKLMRRVRSKVSKVQCSGMAEPEVEHLADAVEALSTVVQWLVDEKIREDEER